MVAALLLMGACMADAPKSPASTFTNFLYKHVCVGKKQPCPAMADAKPDAATTFVRRIKKNKQDADDYHWRGDDEYEGGPGDCEDLAWHRGISIRPFVSAAEARDFYAIICEHSGYIKNKHLQRVRFSGMAGAVRPTPTDEDKAHHDLYKADQFEFSRDVIATGASV